MALEPIDVNVILTSVLEPYNAGSYQTKYKKYTPESGFLNIYNGLKFVLKSDLGRNLLHSTAVLNGTYAQT